MTEPGLRERKKRRTRELIADTAARLFAERGYERVSVLDVAAAAQVSEQTVYNYFPTKADLVLDRDAQLRDQLTAAVARRPPATSPASAVREVALALLDGLATMDEAEVRGGLGYLSLRSPTVRRLALEMTDRHADAIAGVLAAEPGGPEPPVAKLQAVALVWVIQTITDASGLGAAAGEAPADIASRMRPIVLTIIEQLEGWPALTPRSPTRTKETA